MEPYLMLYLAAFQAHVQVPVSLLRYSLLPKRLPGQSRLGWARPKAQSNILFPALKTK